MLTDGIRRAAATDAGLGGLAGVLSLELEPLVVVSLVPLQIHIESGGNGNSAVEEPESLIEFVPFQ